MDSSLKQSHYSAFRRNNEFMNLITLFFIKSIDEIKTSISESVDKLMSSSLEMMSLSESRKNEAQQMMLDAHLSPDREMEDEIKSNQSNVISAQE